MKAKKHYQQALFIAESVGDRQTIANTLGYLGALHALVKDGAIAQQQLALATAIGDRLGIERATADLSRVQVK